jgi:hypothetical protein
MNLEDDGVRQTVHQLITATMLAVLSSTFAIADEPPTHPCAEIADPTQRLACFDKAFPHRTPQARATPPAQKQPPPLPPQEFGFTDAQRRERESSDRKPAGAQEIHAKISELETRRSGMFTATLDNGQLWAQTELNSKARVRTGDTVVIHKAALGSYLLVTPDGIGTRVRRIE